MSEMKSILSGSDKTPAKKSAPKSGVKKVRVVDLGNKGSFKVTKPGALKRKAQAAGESTKEFAESHDKGKGVTARQSRAALGLMGMK
jgi:hypothetical protein